MSEDKRTKIGPTGAQPAVQPTSTPVPASSNVTEYMHPTGTPAPSATPPPQQHQTSYLPPAAPQADPLIGQTLAGRYLIAKKLGEGGMGAVYLATHQLLEKQVALKVLHNEFARKADLVERFIACSTPAGETPVGIDVIGLRPGEKMYEELNTQGLDMQPTTHPRIWGARQRTIERAEVAASMRKIRRAVAAGDAVAALVGLETAVEDFTASAAAWDVAASAEQTALPRAA